MALSPMQKSVCDETNIRACMDELKELADNTPDNFYGDAFIQLRHFFTKHNPGLLTDDDREFRSPIKGLGKPFNELGQDHHEYVWKVRILSGYISRIINDPKDVRVSSK